MWWSPMGLGKQRCWNWSIEGSRRIAYAKVPETEHMPVYLLNKDERRRIAYTKMPGTGSSGCRIVLENHLSCFAFWSVPIVNSEYF